MENIDINEIGRNGYKLLQKNKVISKDISELTFKERKELIARLESMLADILYKKVINKNEGIEEQPHKYNFLFFLYSSIISYLDNTDLNKFINLKPKKQI